MNTKRLWLLASIAWRESGRDNCTQMASAIAYRVLFAAVPLTMFVVSVLGLLAGSEERQEDLVEEITSYLGVNEGDLSLSVSESGIERLGEEEAGTVNAALAGLSDEEEAVLVEDLDQGEPVQVDGVELTADDVEVTSDNLVVETLRGVVDASGAVSIVSFVILAFSASGLFGSVRRSLDFVWGVRVARPMFQGKAFDLVMLVGIMAAFILVILALALGSALRAFVQFEDLGFSGDVLWIASSTAISWLVTFAACAAAFRYVPQVRTRFRDVWPGAVIVATGLEVLKLGFSIYVANFNTFDLVYGALGGVLLFLLLVYWASYIFLIGAEVAAEYPRVRAGEYDDSGPATERKPLVTSIVDAIKGLFVRENKTRNQ